MKPIVGMTMGDPSGIGSELCIKVLSKKEVYDKCRPLVVGNLECIEDAIRFTKSDLKVSVVGSPAEGNYEFGTIDMINLANVDISALRYGEVSTMCGKAAGEYIEKVIALAMSGQIDATVTNAIHKEAFRLGGWGKKYAGHTEMYADLTNTPKYSMMLAHGNLRTVHVTTHVSLRQACDMIKKDRIMDVIGIAHNVCVDLGIPQPKIGVASLNPHAGDGGLFGTEEIEEIIPAIEAARAKGYSVEGPVPGDTVFSKARGGWYDIVVSMYHDQGHQPMKLLGFVYDDQAGKWSSVSGVNITLGLPIIRVSVDHGTAFGKAGKGTASEDSLLDSIDYAVRFAHSREQNKER